MLVAIRRAIASDIDCFLLALRFPEVIVEPVAEPAAGGSTTALFSLVASAALSDAVAVESPSRKLSAASLRLPSETRTANGAQVFSTTLVDCISYSVKQIRQSIALRKQRRSFKRQITTIIMLLLRQVWVLFIRIRDDTRML